MITVLIQHGFLFVVAYQIVINCLIVHMITVSFVFNQKFQMHLKELFGPDLT